MPMKTTRKRKAYFHLWIKGWLGQNSLSLEINDGNPRTAPIVSRIEKMNLHQDWDVFMYYKFFKLQIDSF